MAKGSCDCCDARDVELRHATVSGIETWACAACHGYAPDEFDDDLLPCKNDSQPFVRSDGGCLRCDADAGEVCRVAEAVS